MAQLKDTNINGNLILSKDDTNVNVKEEIDNLTKTSVYHCTQLDGIKTFLNDYLSSEYADDIITVIVKGNMAQLTLKGITTKELSNWTDFFDLDTGLRDFIIKNAFPASYINTSIKSDANNDYTYFFRLIKKKIKLELISGL